MAWDIKTEEPVKNIEMKKNGIKIDGLTFAHNIGYNYITDNYKVSNLSWIRVPWMKLHNFIKLLDFQHLQMLWSTRIF